METLASGPEDMRIAAIELFVARRDELLRQKGDYVV